MRLCTRRQFLLLVSTVVMTCSLLSLWQVSRNLIWRATQMFVTKVTTASLQGVKELKYVDQPESWNTSHVKLSAQEFLERHLNVDALKDNVGHDSACRQVADNPTSFWRSQPGQSTTFTEDADMERMVLAFRCGLLDSKYLRTPPVLDLYHFEEHYLSDPPLLDILNATSETTSKVQLLNVSSQYKLHDKLVLQIDAFDGHGRPRRRGGDEFRVWLSDVTRSGHSIPARVKDLGNGTYLATASLHFTGKLKAQSRILRSIPQSIEIDVCTDSTGEQFSHPSVACHKVPWEETWKWDEPSGFMYKNVWYPSYCTIHKRDTDSCLRNIEVVIYGDSNGRSHYHNFLKLAKCDVVKKELTQKWHKPLLCVDKKNNFTVRWEPHTNPFMNGHVLAEAQSLTPTSVDIDKLSSKGNYLIILNHFFHVTTFHISAIDVMFRSIKEAISRLLRRNPSVTVVLQGPHTARVGWPNHFEAGDMLGQIIMDLQKEIFHDILDKVMYLHAWDMTVAVDNMDFHPSVNDHIFETMMGFVCGR